MHSSMRFQDKDEKCRIARVKTNHTLLWEGWMVLYMDLLKGTMVIFCFVADIQTHITLHNKP